MSTRQAFVPFVSVLTGMAGRVLVSSSRRRTERMISRFSNRTLQDIGFERDWDGSVYRARDLH